MGGEGLLGHREARSSCPGAATPHTLAQGRRHWFPKCPLSFQPVWVSVWWSPRLLLCQCSEGVPPLFGEEPGRLLGLRKRVLHPGGPMREGRWTAAARDGQELS